MKEVFTKTDPAPHSELLFRNLIMKTKTILLSIIVLGAMTNAVAGGFDGAETVALRRLSEQIQKNGDYRGALRTIENKFSRESTNDIRFVLFQAACLHRLGREKDVYSLFGKSERTLFSTNRFYVGTRLSLRSYNFDFTRRGIVEKEYDELVSKILSGPAQVLVHYKCPPSLPIGRIVFFEGEKKHVGYEIPFEEAARLGTNSVFLSSGRCRIAAVFRDPGNWQIVRTNFLATCNLPRWGETAVSIELPKGPPVLDILEPSPDGLEINRNSIIKWRCWPTPNEPLIWWLDKVTDLYSSETVCYPHQTCKETLSVNEIVQALPNWMSGLEAGTYQLSIRMKKPDGKPFVSDDVSEKTGPNLAFDSITFTLSQPVSK